MICLLLFANSIINLDTFGYPDYLLSFSIVSNLQIYKYFTFIT
nr:MAG TPA: hypothetical protein [Myoviridae sp. ctNPX13]